MLFDGDGKRAWQREGLMLMVVEEFVFLAGGRGRSLDIIGGGRSCFLG